MKNLNIYFFSLVCGLLFFESAFANCNIKSANDLLKSFKTKHPQIIENKATVNISKKWVEVAQQRPNPDFEAQVVNGEEVDGDVKKLNLSLLHTFEVGGKRSSRINYANSQQKQLEYSVRDSNENILIDAIVKAYRLRQVDELIPLYQEAYQAFNKILQIKINRKSLSPEEQVEKETLVLATNDYKLKVARLKSEKINLSKHLALYIGESCKISQNVLPKKIDLSKKFKVKKSFKTYSKLQTALMNLETAHTKLELEKSKAYPDLKVGPAFETSQINGKKYQTFGLALSMKLPILNINTGAKNQALMSINKAKLKSKNIQIEAALDLEAWIEKYNELRQSLNTISTEKDLNKKHQTIEKLFKRGVISTAMVIESHRQLIHYANTRYEFQLGAVEALWNIYKLNGTLFNQKI